MSPPMFTIAEADEPCAVCGKLTNHIDAEGTPLCSVECERADEEAYWHVLQLIRESEDEYGSDYDEWEEPW